ncbi:MAG: HYR domain-containing protein, partial [Bacteroidales bacterium]|nr:HYR domain-containing protein [Bacteroidales bacterium]
MNQVGITNPDFIIGQPDNNGVELFTNGDIITIDLIHTLQSGEQYSIFWRQLTGEDPESVLKFFESSDGTNWTEHPLSAAQSITTNNEASYDEVLITANIDTRYIRISKVVFPDFLIDAVTYNADVCLVDPACNLVSSEQLISGYASSLDAQFNVALPGRSLGAPDGLGAQLDNYNDWIIVQLDDIVSVGQEYHIVWKRRDGTNWPAKLYFDESIDGSSFKEHSLSGTFITADKDYYVVSSVSAETNTYYLRFRNPSPPPSDHGDYWIDAVVFDAVECHPTATISPDPATVCEGQDVVLDGNPSGGDGTYTHQWSGPEASSLLATNVQSPTFNNATAGSYNLTYTVTDGNGHTGTDDITVVVSVDVAPVAQCQDITVYLDAAGSASIVPGDVDDGSYDGCGVVTLSLDISSFDCGDLGDNTVTLTVEDNTANTSTCQAMVTVEDIISPTITCGADQTQTADAGVCNASVTVAGPATGDNCGVATVLNDYNGTADASGTYPVGTTTVTWTVTDIHGNTNTCTQDITVTDDEAPTITCGADQTQTADAGVCNASVTVAG